MIKKGFMTVLVILLCIANCYAEGQEGMAALLRLGYFIKVFMCLSLYAIIGGIILILIFRKSNSQIKNPTLKAFSISLLIFLFTAIIFGDDFIFLIWNYI